MHLFLHWLRRDLRRHALLIALWALLVALFTWARLWFRQRGLDYLPERYTVLIGSSLALGLAEALLLLRILLDDPAGGARTFWKTRPPSGGAVFGAKAALLVLVSLAIPFAAEGVFLSIVGPSMDGRERALCLLLPPVFALMAGATATTWKHVMAWLPASFAVMLGAVMGSRWLHQQQLVIQPTDWLLSTVTVLAAAGGLTWLFYHRRKAPRFAVVLALALPAGAFIASSSAGFTDGRWAQQPEGVDVAKLRLEAGGRAVLPPGFGLMGPGFSIQGLADTVVTHTWVRTVNPSVRIASGPEIKIASPYRGGMFEPWALHPQGPVAWLSLSLPAEVRAALDTSAFTATGTVQIFCARQQTLRVPLDTIKHDLSAGSFRWRIQVPAPARPDYYIRPGYHNPERDAAGAWVELELNGGWEGVAWSPVSHENETRLSHTATGETIRLVGIETEPHAPFWEGAGYSRQRLVPKGIKLEETAGAYARIEQIAAEAGSDSPWVLEIDVLVPQGTLEVPFSLTWPVK